MRVTPAIPVTDAILISSSLVEVAPPAYVSGTTYSADQTACRGAVGGLLTVYRSLQAGNLGNTPETSPAWWQDIGATYGVYSSTATYALGDRVIDPIAHLVYESRMAGNVGQSLTVGTAWLEVGPTNKWAAFDRLRSTQASAPVDIVFVLAPGKRVGSIGLIGLDATSATVTVTAGGSEVYSSTTQLSTRNTVSWSGYYQGEFKSRRSFQLHDLPRYRDATITVTVRKSNGAPAVGGIIIGTAIYIGELQYEAMSDHLNFSLSTRNGFGVINLQSRPSIPNLTGDVWFDKALATTLFDLRAEINGLPALWSGIDDYTDPYYPLLNLWGFHKRFGIDPKTDVHGTISLEIEEL